MVGKSMTFVLRFTVAHSRRTFVMATQVCSLGCFPSIVVTVCGLQTLAAAICAMYWRHHRMPADADHYIQDFGFAFPASLIDWLRSGQK
jgi:hypothetical protein